MYARQVMWNGASVPQHGENEEESAKGKGFANLEVRIMR